MALTVAERVALVETTVDKMIADGKIAPIRRSILISHCIVNECDPQTAAEMLGMIHMHTKCDEEKIVREMLEAEQYAFTMAVMNVNYTANFNFLMRRCMAHSKGHANPGEVSRHLTDFIEAAQDLEKAKKTLPK